MTAPAPPLPRDDGPGELEGAGIFSSYDDLNKALATDDSFEIAFAGAAVALDTLGYIVDPFGSLVSAGIGWAFEHFAFLSEPLDALAGNPWEVKAEAKSWHEVSVGLAAAAAAQHDLAGPGSTGWLGEAAAAHRRDAGTRIEQLAQLTQLADRFAVTLLGAGVAVGTLRSIVRDMIADFIAGLITKLVGGAVLAFVTGGIALGAAIAWAVSDALLLATQIAVRIARLLRTLNELLDGSRISFAVELGKQSTTSDLGDSQPGS